MRNKLKKHRVDAGLTQAKLAKVLGVTQPNYYRWEAGQIQIPEAKLKKLAKILGTTTETLLGRHPPVRAAFYDANAPEDQQYYGEVAIHFHGGGEALLLSISEKAHGNLYQALQRNRKFVIVVSLSNQTVVIRTSAISDLYFSSEAYDDFGPEHDTYREASPLHLPDPRDWEIIESIACDEVDIEEFDRLSVDRVRRALRPTTDEEFQQLVRDGEIKLAEVASEKVKEKAKLDHIFELATVVTYQLSNGSKRSVFAESEPIYEAFWEILDWDDPLETDMIRFPTEGYHRTVFINPEALDYVSIPTHKWEEGRINSDSEMIDGFREEDKGKRLNAKSIA